MDAAAVQLAAQVLHAIVVQHRSLVRAALRNMPPLPSLAVLKDVNAVLIQVRSSNTPGPAHRFYLTASACAALDCRSDGCADGCFNMPLQWEIS